MYLTDLPSTIQEILSMSENKNFLSVDRNDNTQFKIITKRSRKLTNARRVRSTKRCTKNEAGINKKYKKEIAFRSSHLLKNESTNICYEQVNKEEHKKTQTDVKTQGKCIDSYKIDEGSILLTVERSSEKEESPLVLHVNLTDHSSEPSSSKDMPNNLEYENDLKKHRCKICSSAFSLSADTEVHMKIMHSSVVVDEFTKSKQTGDFNCPNCHRVFPSESDRDQHNLMMHSIHKNVSCPECCEIAANVRTLESRLKTENFKSPDLQCNTCGVEFVLNYSIRNHNQKSTVKISTKSPTNTMTMKKTVKCLKCTKAFESVKLLRLHHEQDHKSENFNCSLCNIRMNGPFALQKHLVEIHRVGNLNYNKCYDCNKTFQLPQELEEHYLEVHKKEFTLLCYLCGDKFACIEMLKAHKRTHEAFSCNFCSLGFKKQENYLEHLKNVHLRDFSSEAKNFIEVDEDLNDDEMLKPLLEIPPVPSECETFSKILEINDDGTVSVTEQPIEYKKKTDLVTAPNSVTHKNIFEGVKLKDLPKKMNCPICSKLLTTNFLRTHIRSHNGNFPFKCQVCDKSFAQGTLLRKHMRNKHHEEFLKMGNKCPKKKLVQCEYCSEIFEDILSLEMHLWTHMESKNYQCSMCNMKFGMKICLFEHYKNHYFKEEKQCHICKKAVFKSIGYYREHIQKCQSKWLCEECGIYCNVQENFIKHQKMVHFNGTKIYNCEVCNKHFSKKYDFKEHLISHTNNFDFSCSYCPKTFKRATPLKKHLAKHQTEAAGFRCNYCDLVCATQIDLQIHKEEHFQETPCSHCDSIYLSRQALDDHIAVYHTQSRNNSFICSLCSEIFEKQIDFKNHISSHYAEPIFVCETNLCHKIFKKEVLMRAHMTRIHSNLEFSCYLCYRKFFSNSDLQKHISTHFLSSTLKCLKCTFTTNSKVELQNHVRNHSEEPQYECNFCGIKLQQRHHIIKHLQSAHQIKENFTEFIMVNNWKCSACSKVFLSYAATTKHLSSHASHGVEAEGTLLKSKMSQQTLSNSTVSVPLLDTLLPSLKVLLKTDKESKNELEVECWQCPSCFVIIDSQENVKSHFVTSPKCQEAIATHYQPSTKEAQTTVENDHNFILMDCQSGIVGDYEISDLLDYFMMPEDE